MLELSSVTVRIRETAILRDASLEFRPGEVTAIVGPNGAGKSTLLRVLSGELLPSSGHVLLDGVPLRRWNARALARRRAVLPQSSSLQFHFTVAEIVALGCTVHERTQHSHPHDDVIDKALADTGITHLSDRFVPTLSGGERQRAHFARCVAQLCAGSTDSTRILLLDEPTASLDPAHQHHVMARAQSMAEEDCIVVAVVHDLNLAAAYADKLIILSNGRVDFSGSVADGLSARRLARVFDIDVEILDHPNGGRPLIVPLGPSNPAEQLPPSG